MKFNKFLDYLGVATVSVVLILVVLQVTMRYIFNAPLTWSEELAVFVLVWLSFVGSVICMRDHEHIEIEILVDNLPAKIRPAVIALSRIISAVFLAVLVYEGIEVTQMNFDTPSAANQIHMGYVYMIIPLGALGMLYYDLKDLWKMRKGGK